MVEARINLKPFLALPEFNSAKTRCDQRDRS
jgi:hypothetical protein